MRVLAGLVGFDDSGNGQTVRASLWELSEEPTKRELQSQSASRSRLFRSYEAGENCFSYLICREDRKQTAAVK